MKVGRKRILNNPKIPSDHVCAKCKKGNDEVGFKIQSIYISHWCNQCLVINKTPKHIRRAKIVAKINAYQGL